MGRPNLQPEKHFRWAIGVAHKYMRRLPYPIPVDECEQEALLGIMDASKRWNPSKGKFKTFAAHRIMGQIRDWLRASDYRHSRRKSHLVFIPLSALTSASYRVAFDEDWYESFVYTKDNPLDVLSHRDEFDHIVKDFDSTTQKILRYKYQDGLTHQEIAKKFNLSESRISQIHTEAMDYLQIRRVDMPVRKSGWMQNYERARQYNLEHDEIPAERGPHKKIAQWIRTQRKRVRRNELKPKQVELLMELSFWYH